MKESNYQLVEAKSKDYPDLPLCCRIYNASTAKIDPKSSEYLKFLRHLGKKHGSIVATWDIFVGEDGGQTIEIVQEYCSNGTLEKLVKEGGGKKLEELEISLYGWQLLQGMDFLGDIGIVHRKLEKVKKFFLYTLNSSF